MKVKTKRSEVLIDTTTVTIELNGNRYRLSETVDGKLLINKISIEGGRDSIIVYPRSGNEIEVE